MLSIDTKLQLKAQYPELGIKIRNIEKFIAYALDFAFKEHNFGTSFQEPDPFKDWDTFTKIYDGFAAAYQDLLYWQNDKSVISDELLFLYRHVLINQLFRAGSNVFRNYSKTFEILKSEQFLKTKGSEQYTLGIKHLVGYHQRLVHYERLSYGLNDYDIFASESREYNITEQLDIYVYSVELLIKSYDFLKTLPEIAMHDPENFNTEEITLWINMLPGTLKKAENLRDQYEEERLQEPVNREDKIALDSLLQGFMDYLDQMQDWRKELEKVEQFIRTTCAPSITVDRLNGLIKIKTKNSPLLANLFKQVSELVFSIHKRNNKPYDTPDSLQTIDLAFYNILSECPKQLHAYKLQQENMKPGLSDIFKKMKPFINQASTFVVEDPLLGFDVFNPLMQNLLMNHSDLKSLLSNKDLTIDEYNLIKASMRKVIRALIDSSNIICEALNISCLISSQSMENETLSKLIKSIICMEDFLNGITILLLNQEYDISKEIPKITPDTLQLKISCLEMVRKMHYCLDKHLALAKKLASNPEKFSDHDWEDEKFKIESVLSDFIRQKERLLTEIKGYEKGKLINYPDSPTPNPHHFFEVNIWSTIDACISHFLSEYENNPDMLTLVKKQNTVFYSILDLHKVMAAAQKLKASGLEYLISGLKKLALNTKESYHHSLFNSKSINFTTSLLDCIIRYCREFFDRLTRKIDTERSPREHVFLCKTLSELFTEVGELLLSCLTSGKNETQVEIGKKGTPIDLLEFSNEISEAIQKYANPVNTRHNSQSSASNTKPIIANEEDDKAQIAYESLLLELDEEMNILKAEQAAKEKMHAKRMSCNNKSTPCLKDKNEAEGKEPDSEITHPMVPFLPQKMLSDNEQRLETACYALQTGNMIETAEKTLLDLFEMKNSAASALSDGDILVRVKAGLELTTCYNWRASMHHFGFKIIPNDSSFIACLKEALSYLQKALSYSEKAKYIFETLLSPRAEHIHPALTRQFSDLVECISFQINFTLENITQHHIIAERSSIRLVEVEDLLRQSRIAAMQKMGEKKWKENPNKKSSERAEQYSHVKKMRVTLDECKSEISQLAKKCLPLNQVFLYLCTPTPQEPYFIGRLSVFPEVSIQILSGAGLLQQDKILRLK